jgi:hypothetical protein
LDVLHGVCRAKLVPFPASGSFRVLDEEPKLRSDGKRHQVDKARRQGWVPVMPDISLLAASGNPYPPAPYNQSTIQADGDSYRAWTGAAYHAWAMFREEGIFRHPDDHNRLRDRLIAVNDPLSRTKSLKTDLSNIVRDALLDWHLYGIADVLTQNGRTENASCYIALPPGAKL